MSESDDQDNAGTKRERSPSFPYIDLTMAIEHLEKLYAVAKMNEVRLADAADAWGMTATSGSLMRYVAAMGQFNLIDSIGGGGTKKIKVSAQGRRILEDNRPGVRDSLCSEVALLPKLVRGLFFGEDDMPCWGRNRPSDSIAESSLKFDMGFTSDAARRFLSVYDVTISYVADNDSANFGVDTSQQEALESGEIEPEKVAPDMQSTVMEKTVEAVPIVVDPELNDIDYQKAGKGKIRITAVLDAEGLDLLEKQIAAFRMLVN